MKCQLRNSLLIFGLAFCLSACAGKPVVAPPPLDPPPLLASMQADNNDRTGEPGLWMDLDDARKEASFRERVRAVIQNWK